MSKWIKKGWELPFVKADSPAERYFKMPFSPEVNGYEQATVLLVRIPPSAQTQRPTRHPGPEDQRRSRG